jgi:undecaprenyl-diphosphatase
MNKLEAFLHQALFLRLDGTAATPDWGNQRCNLDRRLSDLWGALAIGRNVALGGEAQRRLAVRACLVAVLGVGLDQLIGLVWQHPRPFMIGLGHTSLPLTPDSSFPSDHATVFVGIALTLSLGETRLVGGLTFAAGVSVAWARVLFAFIFRWT